MAVLLCGCLALPSRAWAQTTDITLPGSADPSRIMDQHPFSRDNEDDLEAPDAPKQALAVAPEGTENLKFILNRVTVDNMTAYSPWEIEKIYRSHLGQEISVATLFEIMAAIQQKYLDDGYALTKVLLPNQSIQEGKVHFAVIEGYVDEISVDPTIRSSSVIDDAMVRIHSMKPLNVKKLERIMLVVNDLPDLNVSAVLTRPTESDISQDGGVRVLLQKNESHETRGTLSIDDYGSVFAGPWEVRGNARMFHIGPAYSELEVGSAVGIPIEEQKSGYASYSMPVFGASGAKAVFDVTRSSTEPGSSLSTLDIKGTSYSVKGGISYPVIRQRDRSLRVNAAFEWKNSRTKILGEELFDDRLRILSAGIRYDFTDRWAGYNSVSAHYYRGLDILGVRESGSPDLSRGDGQSDFRKIEMSVGRVQVLPGNFELFALINGQYSYDPLLSSEEFGFGGGYVGRGYDPSEITGDHGVSASFELRYNTDARVFQTTLAIQPYAFCDVGKVWNIDPGDKNKVSAVSAGAGVRFDLGQEWSTDLNFAVPLTRSADNEPKYQNDVGARVLFSLTKRF